MTVRDAYLHFHPERSDKKEAQHPCFLPFSRIFFFCSYSVHTLMYTNYYLAAESIEGSSQAFAARPDARLKEKHHHHQPRERRELKPKPKPPPPAEDHDGFRPSPPGGAGGAPAAALSPRKQQQQLHAAQACDDAMRRHRPKTGCHATF